MQDNLYSVIEEPLQLNLSPNGKFRFRNVISNILTSQIQTAAAVIYPNNDITHANNRLLT